MIRVVLADDHRIFREGLHRLLSSTGDVEVVGQTGNGMDALKLIFELKPDIAVVDISMPKLDGIEVVREVKRGNLGTKIIILTMHNDELTAREAIYHGASGFIIKENAFEDLMGAIKTVFAGGTFLSPSITGGVLDSQTDVKHSSLSYREREVLALIAKGLTNKEVAERLFISIKTVETHRYRIMQKLGLHNTAELVRYAIRKGIISNKDKP